MDAQSCGLTSDIDLPWAFFTPCPSGVRHGKVIWSKSLSSPLADNLSIASDESEAH